MFRTNIDVWRISLLVSLGWSTARCGGAAHDEGVRDEPSESDAADELPGGDVVDNPEEGSRGPVYTPPPAPDALPLAEHLRCNGALPFAS